MNETLVGHLPLSTVDSNISEQEYFDTVIKEPLENRVPVLKNAEVNIIKEKPALTYFCMTVAHA